MRPRSLIIDLASGLLFAAGVGAIVLALASIVTGEPLL